MNGNESNDNLIEIDGLEEFLSELRKYITNRVNESNTRKKKEWFDNKKWVRILEISF